MSKKLHYKSGEIATLLMLGLVLVGGLVISILINNNKITTNSRADTDSFNCSGISGTCRLLPCPSGETPVYGETCSGEDNYCCVKVSCSSVPTELPRPTPKSYGYELCVQQWCNEGYEHTDKTYCELVTNEGVHEYFADKNPCICICSGSYTTDLNTICNGSAGETTPTISTIPVPSAGSNCGSGGEWPCPIDNTSLAKCKQTKGLEFGCCYKDQYGCNGQDRYRWYGCLGQPCTNGYNGKLSVCPDGFKEAACVQSTPTPATTVPPRPTPRVAPPNVCTTGDQINCNAIDGVCGNSGGTTALHYFVYQNHFAIMQIGSCTEKTLDEVKDWCECGTTVATPALGTTTTPNPITPPTATAAPAPTNTPGSNPTVTVINNEAETITNVRIGFYSGVFQAYAYDLGTIESNSQKKVEYTCGPSQAVYFYLTYQYNGYNYSQDLLSQPCPKDYYIIVK